MLARNTLHSRHDVIKQFIIHLHHQTGVTIRTLLYVENIDQPLDGAALEEDSLHDDDEGGGDHHVDIRNMVRINSDDQREAHCSSQTTVGHHKHLLASDRVNAAATLVDREAEEVGGEESNNENEEDGPKCEADIPDMIVSEPGDAEVEEDDAVAGATEHLDEVVDSDPRLWWDVLESIVSLDQTTPNQTDNYLINY